jgi:hypothetical protein
MVCLVCDLMNEILYWWQKFIQPLVAGRGISDTICM